MSTFKIAVYEDHRSIVIDYAPTIDTVALSTGVSMRIETGRDIADCHFTPAQWNDFTGHLFAIVAKETR